MRPGGGKAKGSSFERTVCTGLSLRITRGARDDVLWRSSLSGGRATVAGKKGGERHHVAGDICAVHPKGNPFVECWYTECKFYRDVGMFQALTRGTGFIAKVWYDTRAKAKKAGKAPLLIFKQNGMPALAMLPSWTFLEFDDSPRATPIVKSRVLGADIYLFEEIIQYEKRPAVVRPALHVKPKG